MHKIIIFILCGLAVGCAYGKRIVVFPSHQFLVEYRDRAGVEEACGGPALCCSISKRGPFKRIVKTPGVDCWLHEFCHPEIRGIPAEEEELVCDQIEEIIMEGNLDG